jgi:thiamine pyrophosphokinase
MRAVIVADGDVQERSHLDESWPGWADGVELVIAADGGAVGAERLGLAPDLVVGDMDSIGPAHLVRLRQAGVAIEVAPADKDESDAELAVLAALARGADELTIVGALGGSRLDHTLANIGLLALEAVGVRPIELIDAAARVTLVRAPGADGRPVRRPLPGRVGAVVSLLPLGHDVTGVTTHGLRYALRDDALPAGPARGLSNVREASSASITVGRGLLLVVESPATLSP